MQAINSSPQKASPALPIILILTLPLPLPLPFFFGFWHSCSLVFFSSSNSWSVDKSLMVSSPFCFLNFLTLKNDKRQRYYTVSLSILHFSCLLWELLETSQAWIYLATIVHNTFFYLCSTKYLFNEVLFAAWILAVHNHGEFQGLIIRPLGNGVSQSLQSY